MSSGHGEADVGKLATFANDVGSWLMRAASGDPASARCEISAKIEDFPSKVPGTFGDFPTLSKVPGTLDVLRNGVSV